MKLYGRTTRPGDLDQCLALVGDRFLYDDIALGSLRAMWLELITRDLGRSSVIYDECEPRRVVAFGISVAIERERFAEVDRGCAPFVARRLLDEWRAGVRPFLDEAAFAAANCGDGLCVLATHDGMIETDDPVRVAAILAAVAESFMVQHSGLNIAGFSHESFRFSREFAVEMGLIVRSEYPSYESILAGVPRNRQPFVVSMTRDEAARHPGNLVLNQMFLRFNAPQFAFAATERRLLRFALEGETDATIADILAIAPATLKKRWARIYEAMEAILGSNARGDDGRRGTEARRHVLHYIRHHPEELHAHRAPTTVARSAHSRAATHVTSSRRL